MVSPRRTSSSSNLTHPQAKLQERMKPGPLFVEHSKSLQTAPSRVRPRKAEAVTLSMLSSLPPVCNQLAETQVLPMEVSGGRKVPRHAPMPELEVVLSWQRGGASSQGRRSRVQ